MLVTFQKSPRSFNQKLCRRWKKRISGMPEKERSLFWSAYRWLRKNFWFNLSTPKEFSYHYHQRYADLDIATQLLALKLAQHVTWHTLASHGATHRKARHLGHEFFHLVRLHLKAHYNNGSFEEGPIWSRGTAKRHRTWTAISDGSVRPGHSGVGIVIYDDTNEIRAQLSIALNPLENRSPVVCELKAAEMALQMMWALGARDAILQTDSASVIQALHGKLTSKHILLIKALQCQTERFDSLSVVRKPRTTTWLADSLACGNEAATSSDAGGHLHPR